MAVEIRTEITIQVFDNERDETRFIVLFTDRGVTVSHQRYTTLNEALESIRAGMY